MQRLMTDELGRGLQPDVTRLVGAIQAIPEQRGFGSLGQVYANLMRAPRFEPTFDERCVAVRKNLEHSKMRNGRSSLLDVRRKSKPRLRMTTVKRANLRYFGDTASNGLVGALDTMSRKFALEAFPGLIRLGDDQKATRVLVDAMHNPRSKMPESIALIGELRPKSPAREQAVDERARCVPPGGVNDEPRGLIDDEQLFILVDDVNRNGPVRLGTAERRVPGLYLDDVTCRDSIARPARATVDAHAALPNPGLNLGPRHVRNLGRKPLIDALVPGG